MAPTPVRPLWTRSALPAALGLLALGAPLAGPVTAQSGEAPDSATIRAAAEEAQARLEQFREESIPPTNTMGGGLCDDLVGRQCLRFGGEDRGPIGQEPIQVDMARREVIDVLDAAGTALPGDRWILGQRVFYLVEAGSSARALALAERCELTDEWRWWCDALRGFILHKAGETAEADAAFAAAMAGMPAAERARWEAPTWLLDGDGQELLDGVAGEGRRALVERLWLLADPLYLVPLNDRRTEHHARRTYVLLREEAENAFGLEWEEDLEQLTVRYGGVVGYERDRAPPQLGNLTQDTRHIVGRHHPDGRDYVPPGEVLSDPGAVAVGAWQLESARPRTGYAPHYAPVIEGLDAQVARFRRGDSLLVVAAFAPPGPEVETPERMAAPERRRVVDDPFAREELPPREADPSWGMGDGPTGDVQTGLFLVDPDDTDRRRVEGTDARDVMTLMAPNGPWIVSAEVFEPGAGRAWRARGGASQGPLPQGLVAVSDILVLDVGDAPPDGFDEALPRARADLDLRVGEPFGMAWEVYGLRAGEGANVAIGLREGSPGLFRRLGEMLRIVDPEQPVLLSFEDSGPDQMETVFRAVDLSLPELEPGEYTLILEITIPGREPVVSNRTVWIVP